MLRRQRYRTRGNSRPGVAVETPAESRRLAVESRTMFNRGGVLIPLAAGLVLSLAGCTMWEQKPTAWSNATGAEQFERLLWQEIKARNWTEVERRLAPTFVEVTANGTRDRDPALERLKALQVEDYSLGELAVRPSGSDMIVAYTITLRPASGGETTLRMMTVWQQVKGGWVAVAHSETSATSP